MNRPVRLQESDIIDPAATAHYAFLSAFNSLSTQLHTHDFYEIFLVRSGTVRHVVNGEAQTLTAGTLVFIRPDDAHFYQRSDQQECQLLNLAFMSTTAQTLFAYLGDDFESERLLQVDLPPTAHLTEAECATLLAQVNHWTRTLAASPAQARLELRTLLAIIFTRYFPIMIPAPTATRVDWLDTLCRAMQQPEHFVGGVERMQQLAGRSPEHLARMFRQHLDMTPTTFVNGLRLDYAAKLLAHSDMAILEVALEAGFENLSHFYHLFQKRFRISPLHYRRTNRRTAIP